MPGFEIIDKKEAEAISNLFKKEKGILFAHGFDKVRKKYHVRELEKNISKKINCKYSLAVSSGTAAIKIALLALGVKRGDEVITQSFNFIATIEAILDIGAKPVIANIDYSLNISPYDIEKLITKKTKVLLPVHMLGVPVDMDAIMKLAKKHKLKVLEDNCEAFGGTYKNKFLGTIGDVGVMSLDFGKIITCGEGGVIHTNSKKIDKFCREYHDHGHENNSNKPRGRDTRSIYGFNYRMTEMQGVIAKAQLKKINYIISENKTRYKLLEQNISNKIKLRKIPKNSKIIYDTFIFFVDDKSKRQKIIKILSKLKIGTKNLPDAIEWHCSFYWNHMLNKNQLSRSKKSKDILKTALAVPIYLNKNLSIYKKLINNINSLF
jgi:8-amino-3,8-dideoxy-alpha-D-manno-octulosonate transaminase